MKKFIFSLAALMVVACTAISLSSCGDDDSNSVSVNSTLRYEFGWTTFSWKVIGNGVTKENIKDIYIEEFKKITGCTVSSSTISVVGTDASQYDSKIKSACSTAEARIKALDFSNNSGTIPFTVTKYTDSGSEIIYSYTITGGF